MTPQTQYQKARSWSDLYLPSMNAMAFDLMVSNNLLSPTFQLPSDWDDRRLGIDMTMTIDKVKLAYRTRKFDALEYALKGFTVRTTGSVSELQKITSGVHADYFLYGIAHPDDNGTLHAGILIDLKSVGEQINRFPEILESATWKPNFVDLKFDSFPHDVDVGWFGVNKIERVH